MTLLGALDAPISAEFFSENLLPNGKVLVKGWAFQDRGEEVWVRARVGTGPAAETRVDKDRADVGLSHPAVLQSCRSGFVLLVDVPASETAQLLTVEAFSGNESAVLFEAPLEGVISRHAYTQVDLDRFGPPAPVPSRRSREPGEPLSALFVSHNLNLEGAPISLFDLGSRLADRGMAVRVLGPSEGPLSRRWVQAGVPVDYVGIPAQLAGFDDYRMRIKRLAAILCVHRPDLVVGNTLDSFWAMDLAQELGVASAWIVRESTDVRTYFFERWPYDIAVLGLESFKKTDSCIFVSHATADLFQRTLPELSSTVIHNGLELSPFEKTLSKRKRARQKRTLGLPSDRPLVTCVGTVCPRKGQHVLLESIAMLLEEIPSILCVLVGVRPDPYLDSLNDRTKNLGIQGNVRFVAEVENPFPYYQVSDVIACPSFEESLPRVVIEGMASGNPVVATDVYGIPELIKNEEHGLLVPPGDPPALADAIRRNLEDPTWASECGARAKERVFQDFTIDRTVDEYESLFRSIVSSGDSRS